MFVVMMVVVLGNVWISSNYLTATIPRKQSISENNNWNTNRFFHIVHAGRRIEGSLPIKFDKRQGYFDFDNAGLWKRVNDNEYESYQHCEYCSNNDSECQRGKLIVFKPSGDVKGPFYAPIARMINQRAYTANVTTIYPKFRPIFIRCELTQPLPVDQAGGKLYIDQRKLHVLINPQTTSNNKEDVVCGRGIYGHRTDAESIHRFTRYYLERWKFHRVILYNIRLNDFAHAKELQTLIATGKLVVLDFTSEYERLYGDHSRDVVLFSNNLLQLDHKFDCITRAKAMGARWTFHVDIDEYLFESQPRSLPPPSSFNDYIESKFGNLLTHLAFAIQTINRTVQTRLCECNHQEFNLDLFVSEENEKHAREVALHAGGKLPGPFHHTNGHMSAQRGKRKVLIRVDKLEVNPWHIGIHIARHCSVVDLVTQTCIGNDVGRNVDPLREMYLREFSCSNMEICKPEVDVEWWK